MAHNSVHYRGITVGTPVPRAEGESADWNNEVKTYTLSPEELARYRGMDKPKDKPPVGPMPEKKAIIEEASDMGTFNLTKEQYLAKRAAGLTRAQIAKEQGVQAGGLLYHLGKFGLKDSVIEQRVLDELKEQEAKTDSDVINAPPAIDVNLHVTKEPTQTATDVPEKQFEETKRSKQESEYANTSSPPTYPQVVDNSEVQQHSEATEERDYITIRIPLRFEGLPATESGKVGFNRNELIENGVKSLQSAAAWAYKEMLELLADEATIERVENFMQRKIGAV